MGLCLSSSPEYSTHGGGSSRKPPCAHVVSSNGQLRQYPVPITVVQVLQSEASSPESFFLCNSDKLYFDDFIPALKVDEELQSSQIYFVLPRSKLQYRLAASDMAALAVKASVALEQINRRNGRNRKSRISPVIVVEDNSDSDLDNYEFNQAKVSPIRSNYQYPNVKGGGGGKATSSGAGMSRSGSVRKLSRYSSRRAKLAVRSFRMKLNTIYEGTVLYQS